MSGHTGQKVKIVLALIFYYSWATVESKLSNYVTICSAKNPELEKCMKNSAQEFVGKLKSGIPEYDLPAIDPMMVPIVDFHKAGMGLTLVIKNSTHSGIGDMKFTKVLSDVFSLAITPHKKIVCDCSLMPLAVIKAKRLGCLHPIGADPANYQFEFHTVLPMHSIMGTYSVDGKVMMLPIKGEGKTNITLHNVEGVWKLYGQPYMRNGTKYMKLKEFHVSVVPNLMAVNFENLFNGNKMLGEIMNEVLNTQWKDLYRYVKPALEKSHSDILAEFAEKFFSKVPYEEMFLDL